MQPSPNAFIDKRPSNSSQCAPDAFPPPYIQTNANRNMESPTALKIQSIQAPLAPLAPPSGPPQGIFYENNHHITPREFPSDFDPRTAANMSAIEKVSKWIHQIPYYVNEDHEIFVDCFPGVTEYSSSTSCSHQNLDYSHITEILELQARKVTRFTVRNYLNEPEILADNSLDDIYYYDSDGVLVVDDDDDPPLQSSSNKKSDYLIQALF